MSILTEINEAVQKGKAKLMPELLERALGEGLTASVILNEGLLPGMDVVGEKFKNNEVFVPEVLVAARAMKTGTDILQPLLKEGGVEPIGKAIIGTVKGDLHDIGKNLVKMMFEGKGIEVIDLGVDVSAEQYLESFKTTGAKIICCSALLTTTMTEMQRVVDIFTEAGLRDQVTIMIGGAPVNDDFRNSIKADIYTPDAATAADAAKKVLVG